MCARVCSMWGETVLTKFLDRVASLLGPILVAFAVCLISFCTYVFFKEVLPFLNFGGVAELCTVNVGVFLLANCMYNYYKCVVTSPGYPPLAGESDEEVDGDALTNRLGGYSRIANDYDTTPTSSGKCVCSKCMRVRPKRTHHCSVCKTCVLKMDHHCPWIYNCVGLHNQKFFYLFMFYLFLVDGFFILTSFSLFKSSLNGVQSFETRSSVIMAFVLAVSVEIAMFCFLSFHTYLIVTNQTTLEFISRDNEHLRREAKFVRNPFNVGTIKNISQVFGEKYWAFPFLHKDEKNEKFPTIGHLRVGDILPK